MQSEDAITREMSRRARWSISIYCMRASSFVNKPGYLWQKAEDILLVISRLFSCLFSVCGKFSLVRICEVKDKLGCVFTENRGQQETVFAC